MRSIQSNTMSGTARNGFPSDVLVTLDRSRPRSLRAQLERALRDAIARGSLAPGAALPPSRVLARELDVSRSVVAGAYEQLVIEGYLQARRRSGAPVRPRDPGSRPQRPVRRDVPFWPVPEAATAPPRRSGLPDPALLPGRTGCATTAMSCAK